MNTITLPGHILPRLGRLHLLADSGRPGSPLSGVNIVCRNNRVTLAATNGMSLAQISCDSDTASDDFSCTLNAAQLCNAIVIGSSNGMTLEIGPSEARITHNTHSSIAKVIDGPYPGVLSAIHGFTSGAFWIHSICDLDYTRVATIAKFLKLGKNHALLFRSAIDCAVMGGNVAMARSDFENAKRSPAIWADDHTFVLLMPMASPEPKAIDMAPHRPTAVAVAS